MTIAAARAMFERVCASGQKRMLVGLSGGKDSLAVLDLAVEVFGAANIETFFMRLVAGLRVEMGPVERAVSKYGVKLHVVPHWMLSELLRKHACRDPILNVKVPRVMLRDIEQHLRRETSIDWIAYGHRASESLVRNAMLRRQGMNGFDEKQRKIYPLWDWSTSAVYAYLRQRRIPAPKPIGTTLAGQAGGVGLNPRALEWLKANAPQDFEKVRAVFPYCEALLVRSAARKAREDAKVRDAAAAPLADQGRAVQPAFHHAVRAKEARKVHS